MKRTLLSLLFLISFIPLSEASLNDVLSAVRPLQGMRMNYETGEMEMGNICTTTSINEDQHYWLTAAHCIEEQTWIQGDPTTIVFQDAVTDLAVLTTPLKKAHALKLQAYYPYMGQKVRMVGYPQGHTFPQFFKGIISQPRGEGDYIWFDMSVCGGNSGSSVVNEKDEIVSVMQVGYGRPCSGLAGGANWGTLVRQTKKFFKR